MKDLDKTQVYDLRGVTEKQVKELLKWLKVNDKGWDMYSHYRIMEYGSLEYVYTEWKLSGKEPTTHILTLFGQSYEEQKLQEIKKKLDHYKKEVERLESKLKPKINDVCKFWNDDESDFVVGTVVKIKNQLLDGTSLIFLSSSGYGFNHAIRVTEQEVIDLLFKKSC